MAHLLLASLVVVSLLHFSTQFTDLSSTTVTTLKSTLRSVVRGSTLPTAVRLSFHDCVGRNKHFAVDTMDIWEHVFTIGGCNGCLNVDNDDNAGLADLVADLETTYQDNGYDSILSR